MANAQAAPKRRPARQPKKNLNIVPIAIAILVLLVGGWALKTFFVGAGPKTILLMGLDEGKTRTDVVVLAHVNPGKGIVNAISLPRDTLVDIDCDPESCLSPDKLAHAHAYGGDKGPEMTVKAVESLLGIKIDHYVRVDYEGFSKVIDALGGVSIVIDQNMDYEDPYAHPPLKIHFKASPEPQHLNGAQALNYVRFRNDGLGDIGRIQRTKKFAIALFQTLKGSGKISKLPGLVGVIHPYVTTDLDLSTAVSLAGMAAKLEAENIHMTALPGADATLDDGRWVWLADKEKTQELVDTLIKMTREPAPEPAEE